MGRDLYALQLKELELLTQMTDHHPLLAPLKEQVERAGAIVEEQPGERVQTTTSISPTRQPLELALLQERANLAGLIAESAAIAEQRAEQDRRLAAINDAEREIAELERELARAESTLQGTMDRLHQARVDQSLDAQRISNIGLVQAPTLVHEPAAPNRLFVLAIGVVGSLIGGVLAACLMEWCFPRLRSAADVESRMGVPVLLEMPRYAMSRLGDDGWE